VEDEVISIRNGQHDDNKKARDLYHQVKQSREEFDQQGKRDMEAALAESINTFEQDKLEEDV
jgi:hypothetical protein